MAIRSQQTLESHMLPRWTSSADVGCRLKKSKSAAAEIRLGTMRQSATNHFNHRVVRDIEQSHVPKMS